MRAVCRVLAVAVILSAAVGCASTTRLPAVPKGLTTKATLGNIQDARIFPTRNTGDFVRIMTGSVKREMAYRAKNGLGTALPTANFLAISGGGEDGAFGVGLLVGWTESGKRPKFKGVTGVSTGALIAPFAFLGSKYDKTIKALYTNVDPDSIFRSRGIIAGLLNDALADTQPLRRLVRKYLTREILSEIAREYRNGRVLLIGTTDLDAKVPVYWNMGAIAAHGTPESQRLFQEVLIASAAVPGAFPPVMIEVTAGRKRHQEMHVDGGTISQLFLYPTGLEVRKIALRAKVPRKRRAFIIRNSKLDPSWVSVKRQTLSIIGVAVSALIAAQGNDAIVKLYLATKRDGIDYNLAYIPKSFTREAKEPFEKAYMNALYRVGYDLARKGYRWRKAPPGYSR